MLKEKQIQFILIRKFNTAAVFHALRFAFWRSLFISPVIAVLSLFALNNFAQGNERVQMIQTLSTPRPRKKLITNNLPTAIMISLIEDGFADYKRMQCSLALSDQTIDWHEAQLASLIADLSQNATPQITIKILGLAAQSFTTSVPQSIEEALLPLMATTPNTAESLVLMFRMNFAPLPWNIPANIPLFLKRCGTLAAFVNQDDNSLKNALNPQVKVAIQSLRELSSYLAPSHLINPGYQPRDQHNYQMQIGQLLSRLPQTP